MSLRGMKCRNNLIFIIWKDEIAIVIQGDLAMTAMKNLLLEQKLFKLNFILLKQIYI